MDVRVLLAALAAVVLVVLSQASGDDDQTIKIIGEISSFVVRHSTAAHNALCSSSAIEPCTVAGLPLSYICLASRLSIFDI